MKLKKVIATTLLAVVLTTTASSSFKTFAKDINPANLQSNLKKVDPRYQYIRSASLIIDLNSSGADYNLNIICISEVTSISGTITLYKKNSSGIYESVDYERINESGNSIDITSSLSTNGAGAYKLEFSGRVYTNSGSEPIRISKTDSN